MAQTMFTARCGDESWRIELHPGGAVLGRGNTCDVVIDRMEVSRRHVRAFCDPSGRWIFEDLGSSNGLFLNGVRVEACTVGPGDVVTIGPVSLTLEGTPDPQAPPTVEPPMPHIVVQDFGMEVFYDKPRLEDCTTPPCPDRIGKMRERLSQSVGLPALYEEACRIAAERTETMAAVFQTSRQEDASSRMPTMLAHHFAANPDSAWAHPDGGWEKPRRAFRVSHRLLEAVRTGGKPLMTKTVCSCDTQLTISLIDEHSARAIICTPLRGVEQMIDLLYVDSPIDERTGPGAEETFAFVQAVAQAVGRHDACNP